MQHTFVPIVPEHDKALAALIRHSLKEHHLDIPGTAYYDECLDHLSAFYNIDPRRAYYVLLNGDQLLGGIGLAEYDGLEDCCELQKLYLDPSLHGMGLGYKMIEFIEEQARSLGYRRIYLETHKNLSAAIHEYEKMNYQQINHPAGIVHSAMNRFYVKEL